MKVPDDSDPKAEDDDALEAWKAEAGAIRAEHAAWLERTGRLRGPSSLDMLRVDRARDDHR